MNKDKVLKYTGIALSVVGMGLQIANGILDDKKLNIKIAKEVSKQVDRIINE